MGIASLIIGIICVILAIIPGVGWFALLPAIIGLILGIISITRNKSKNKSTGVATAGTVLCAIAIAFTLIWTLLLAGMLYSVIETITVSPENVEAKISNIIKPDEPFINNVIDESAIV